MTTREVLQSICSPMCSEHGGFIVYTCQTLSQKDAAQIIAMVEAAEWWYQTDALYYESFQGKGIHPMGIAELANTCVVARETTYAALAALEVE